MPLNRVHVINNKNNKKNKRITGWKKDKKYIHRNRYDGITIDDKIKA